MPRDFYKVLVVGSPGKGKTYGARTLDPETTGYINTEGKPLPFKNNFKYYGIAKTKDEVFKFLNAFAKMPQIKTIVFDSLSFYAENSLREIKARGIKGFEIYNQVNESYTDLFDAMNSIPKEFIIISHEERLQTLDGDLEKRAKALGKAYEGMIEKVFTIVLFAATKKQEGSILPTYWLNLYQEGTSAKTPPDIFGADESGRQVTTIPNDYKMLMEKIWEFVGENNTSDVQSEKKS